MSAAQPTAEQLAALRAYATANGRTWKSKLLHSWETGDTHGQWTAPLRQVRNNFGPSWLVRFKFPAAQAAPAISGEAFTGAAVKRAAHTPAPWTIRRRTGEDRLDQVIEFAGSDTHTACAVAVIFPEDDHSEAIRMADANARLIHAAPDLATSAADFLAWFKTFVGRDCYAEINCEELTALRAALAKAGVA
jgi:hypothetical protein